MTSPTRLIRWGVIGCGGIAARRTIPEFQKEVKNAVLTAVMDKNAECARAIAGRFGIPNYCANEAELLRMPIDAVYIASPSHCHCRQVVMAARAGKHILCEKPMAHTTGEATRMAAACKSSQVQFMLGFCMRNNPNHIRARQLVQSGSLGRPVMGRAQLTCWYPPIPGAWRQNRRLSPGGALLDMGTHCLDLLEWIFDSRIIEVAGMQDLLVHKYPTRIEDSSTIIARFENGAHGIIDNYFNVPDAAARNVLELYGTGGVITGAGTIGQEAGGKLSCIFSRPAGYNARQHRPPPVRRREYQLTGGGLYAKMITDFSHCLNSNNPPPATIADGRHSVSLVEAIYKAVRSRRAVKVNRNREISLHNMHR